MSSSEEKHLHNIRLVRHYFLHLDEQKFKSACDQIKKFSKRPPDSEMLEVYSLYKQATVGDANIPKPTTGGEAKAKWEAWNTKKGLNSTSAKELYVTKVKALAPKYA